MEWVQAAKQRYEKTKRPTRSDQQVFIEWLLDNPNVEFTVSGLAKELGIESGKISAHIRNTKRWFGFKYSVTKISERYLPRRIYAFTGYKEESNTQILNNVFR